MRLACRLLALGLVWMMTPGLSEVTENVRHLAVAGHTAHSPEAGPDHAPDSEEHGCSGPFHICSCHHSTPMTLVLSPTCREAAPQADPAGRTIQAACQSPDLPGLFRPPRA